MHFPSSAGGEAAEQPAQERPSGFDPLFHPDRGQPPDPGAGARKRDEAEAPDVATLMGDLFTRLAEQRRSRELPLTAHRSVRHHPPLFRRQRPHGAIVDDPFAASGRLRVKGDIFAGKILYPRSGGLSCGADRRPVTQLLYGTRCAPTCPDGSSIFVSVWPMPSPVRAPARWRRREQRAGTRKHHCANWMPDSVKSRPCSRPNLTSPPSKSPNTWGSIGAPR